MPKKMFCAFLNNVYCAKLALKFEKKNTNIIYTILYISTLFIYINLSESIWVIVVNIYPFNIIFFQKYSSSLKVKEQGNLQI